MEKVFYKIEQIGDLAISITPCTRLKRKNILVGTGNCLACSYCYDINTVEKYILCKKVNTNEAKTD